MERQCGPHYSSDIAAAWEVMEKMLDEGLMPAIQCLGNLVTIYGDETDNSKLEMAEKHGLKTIRTVAMAHAETMPLAICLAALKAKGIEVGEVGKDVPPDIHTPT
jgi:hypothetical protein